MNGDEEFRLHLYDKLWENIIHKENRLWTFLSFYGAAVGLVLGTGTLKSFPLEAAFVVLILTYWAAELVIDSDWWSIRNRMMVQGIEKKMPEAGRGIIPTFYQEARFSSESLHSVSLLVFTLVGIGTYWAALRRLPTLETSSPFEEAAWASLLYVGIVLAAVRCEHVRECRVRDYFSTFLNLYSQGKQVADVSARENELMPTEISDKGRQTWRGSVLLTYAIATSILLWYYRAVFSSRYACLLAIVLTLTIGTYLWLHQSYRRVGKEHVGFWQEGYRVGYGCLAFLFFATAAYFLLMISWRVP